MNLDMNSAVNLNCVYKNHSLCPFLFTHKHTPHQRSPCDVSESLCVDSGLTVKSRVLQLFTQRFTPVSQKAIFFWNTSADFQAEALKRSLTIVRVQ